VKRKIRRTIEKRKRKIERRLVKALEQDGQQPTLTASNIHYELAERNNAINQGGIGLAHQTVRQTGLIDLIDERVEVLKIHAPYHESDHVLNIAYNGLCGGMTLDDIELRRNDSAYLDALGTESIPDPTTAGDFCRRFEESDIEAMMDAFNAARLRVWQQQPSKFFERACIDADGTMVGTLGECKQGMDIYHKGVWGYHPLVVSLANTQEPLFILNRSGNRPSHEGAPKYFDRAIALCREAGFREVLLRGDTDFSLTKNFDRWDADGVKFIFGFDAKKSMVARAEGVEEYRELERHAARVLKTQPRERPENVKERIVIEREYKNLRLKSEEVAEFDYKPKKCKRSYRVVVVAKNISVEKGEQVLFDEVRYFFYITNERRMTAEEIVRQAGQRCNQENLIAQLKSGVRALHAPVNTLNANWAYMVMTSLAWSIKTWMALLLPVTPRWQAKHEKERVGLLRMEFRKFSNIFIMIPCQIAKTGRRIVYRLLSWTPWQPVFFRLWYALRP
jgi:hypothetical protein